ncbi:PH domain-containing protein [Patescibacteria group bacterium]|nr:PH domain-containing protein [Patescibacteria group bacterium]
MNALLGHFVSRPRGVYFDGQDSGEEILLFLRQHIVVNVRWLLVTALLILAVPLLDFVLSFGNTSLAQILPPPYYFITRFMLGLFTFGYFFENFLNWYFNSYIITNKRVVDIDFYGLTHRRFSEAPLRNIEDVTNNISGLAQVIFHFGDVSVQTAAELREITFENVPNPDRVQDTLSDLISQIRKESE